MVSALVPSFVVLVLSYVMARSFAGVYEQVTSTVTICALFPCIDSPRQLAANTHWLATWLPNLCCRLLTHGCQPRPHPGHHRPHRLCSPRHPRLRRQVHSRPALQGLRSWRQRVRWWRRRRRRRRGGGFESRGVDSQLAARWQLEDAALVLGGVRGGDSGLFMEGGDPPSCSSRLGRCLTRATFLEALQRSGVERRQPIDESMHASAW